MGLRSTDTRDTYVSHPRDSGCVTSASTVSGCMLKAGADAGRESNIGLRPSIELPGYATQPSVYNPGCVFKAGGDGLSRPALHTSPFARYTQRELTAGCWKVNPSLEPTTLSFGPNGS